MKGLTASVVESEVRFSFLNSELTALCDSFLCVNVGRPIKEAGLRKWF